MAGTLVRVSTETHAKLQNLSQQCGAPMPAVLDQAVEAYRRQVFLQETNEAFAALRRNPRLWKQEQEERALWDRTLSDDLSGDAK